MTLSVLVTCSVARHSFANSPVRTRGAQSEDSRICPTSKSKRFLHRPILIRCGDELLNNGSLLGSCPCVPQHHPFRGTDAQTDFVSSSSQSPGSSFWKLCLADVDDGSLLFLGDGEVSLKAAHPFFNVFFSFSSGVFIRERPFILPGSTDRCRALSWRTSPAQVTSRVASGPLSLTVRWLRSARTLVFFAALRLWAWH